MDKFVTSQVTGVPSKPRKPQGQPDAERVQQTRSLKLPGFNMPDSGQQRHETHGKRTSGAVRKAQRDDFDSELEDTTIASVTPNRVIVKDSQVDEFGRPINHPMHRQNQPVVNDVPDEDNQDGSSADGDDHDEFREHEEDGAEFEHPEDNPALRNYNAFVSQSNLRAPQADTSVFDRHQDGDSYPATTSGQGSQNGEEALQYGPLAVDQKSRGAAFRKPDLPVQKQAPSHHIPTASVQAPSSISRPAVASQAVRPAIPQGAVPTHNRGYAGTSNLANRPATMPAAYGKVAPAPAGTIQSSTHPSLTGHQNTRRVNSSGAQSIDTIVPQAADLETAPISASLLSTRLNVDLQELYNVPYEKLHQQALVEKAVQPPDMATDEDATKSLTKQLKVMQKMNKDSKTAFLANLTLDQWEEAGDWFIEQFGAVVKNLTVARQERRKLEKGFGEEILARHQRIQSKKRTIDAALEAMGRSGQGVLKAGTPKKQRIS